MEYIKIDKNAKKIYIYKTNKKNINKLKKKSG